MQGFMRQRGSSWELRVHLGRDAVTGRKRHRLYRARGEGHEEPRLPPGLAYPTTAAALGARGARAVERARACEPDLDAGAFVFSNEVACGVGRLLAVRLVFACRENLMALDTRPTTRGSRTDSGGFEELPFDEIGEPGLPFAERPAPLGDEEVVGGAVHEGEEGVDGAASVDPVSELTVLYEKVDQALLGAKAPPVVLVDQLACCGLGCCRIAQDFFERGGAGRDLGCPLDDEPQLATSVLLAARLVDPVPVQDGDGRIVARHRNIQRGRQHGVLGAERLVDGRRRNQGRQGDVLHGRVDVPVLEEESKSGLDDPAAGAVGARLSPLPGLRLPLDRLRHQ